MRPAISVAGLLILAPGLAQEPQVRLKEVLQLHGIRPNTLEGKGIVTGLQGTGDGTAATRQALVSFLTRMNMKVRSNQVASGNVALVHVTAELTPFARHGTRLDVNVQSVGEATSLRGGTLLLTELRGSDGQVYALAAGPMTIGGFEAKGAAAKLTRNHPTAGSIPNGGICEPPVESLVPDRLTEKGELSFLLRHPSAETARRAEKAINGLLAKKNCGFARLEDQGNLTLQLTEAFRSRDAITSLIADIEALRIAPDVAGRIIINEKTGTIIVGQNVRLSPCLVQVADLTVEIIDDDEVSQPTPFSEGQTIIAPRSRITVTQDSGQPTKLDGGASLNDLIQGLQALRIDGQKMMTVLTELHRARYLHGELISR